MEQEDEEQIPPNSIEEQIRLLDGVISRYEVEEYIVPTGPGLLAAIESAATTVQISTGSTLTSTNFSSYLTTIGNEITWVTSDYYPANPSQFTLDQEEEEKLRGSIFNLLTLTKE